MTRFGDLNPAAAMFRLNRMVWACLLLSTFNLVGTVAWVVSADLRIAELLQSEHLGEHIGLTTCRAI